MIDYPVGDATVSHEFGQRVSFSHDGGTWLNYSSISWLLDDAERSPLTAETGYWRLRYTPVDEDAGPGMLPGTGARRFGTAEAVETLRTKSGFEIEASIIHPDGVDELYIGHVNGPRIDLATDAVMRSSTAKEYSAATRLYGLVEGHLLWAWDIAALGQDMRSHASARLARTE